MWSGTGPPPIGFYRSAGARGEDGAGLPEAMRGGLLAAGSLVPGEGEKALAQVVEAGEQHLALSLIHI